MKSEHTNTAIAAGTTTGLGLRGIFRENKTTIKAFSKRTGITQIRVRYFLQRGITNPNQLRDWIQAASSSDPGFLPRR